MWRRLPVSVIADSRQAHLAKQRSWPRRFKITAGWTGASLVLFALGFRGVFPRMGILITASTYQGPVLPLLLVSPLVFFLILPMVILSTGHDTRYTLAGGGICSSCGRTYGPTRETRCACGHALEPFAHFEWIESDSDSRQTGQQDTPPNAGGPDTPPASVS